MQKKTTKQLVKLSEEFLSIQGEPQSLGKSSYFVRFKGCNLHCDWCDTKYASQPNNEEGGWENCDNVIRRALRSKAQQVVFTGGEPLLQREALAYMVRKLMEKGKEVEIETNGTFEPLNKFNIFPRYNVSPKLANSGNRKIDYKYLSEYPKAIFKFVISDKEDITRVKAFVGRHDLSAEKVYLMPEGDTLEKWRMKTMELLPHIIKSQYTLAPRLHILPWDKKRGV